jgi:hypothetical protein
MIAEETEIARGTVMAREGGDGNGPRGCNCEGKSPGIIKGNVEGVQDYFGNFGGGCGFIECRLS